MITDINEIKGFIVGAIKNNIDIVRDVYTYEKVGFEGYPSITIIHLGNENDFHSNQENMRVFRFAVRTFVLMDNKSQIDGISDSYRDRAESITGDIVSKLLDYFDVNLKLGGEIDFITAVPSDWEYIQTADGWCRSAVVILNVHKSFSVK